MYKKKYIERLIIKDWATRVGIKIKEPCGFKGKKSKIWNYKYTENQFKEGLKNSYITVNTQKGIAYLEVCK